MRTSIFHIGARRCLLILCIACAALLLVRPAPAMEAVREAIRLHSLTRPSAIAHGKALTVMVYAGACLKDPDRSISVSVRGNGEGGEISVSGNGRLQLRG